MLRTIVRLALSVAAVVTGISAQSWQQMLPAGRMEHALVYDLPRGRTVLFGGRTQIAVLSDTWEYDGARWTRIATAVTPPLRSEFAVAYDLARARTVLFGGAGAGVVFNDTWEYDGLNWTQIATVVSPPARISHALAHDAVRGRTVLFGGATGLFAGAPMLNDTWEYNGTTWTAVGGTTAPSPRVVPALAYDVARGRTVLFGGVDATSTTLADTWEWNGTNWTQRTTAVVPPARGGPSLAWDLARNRTVLFGGRSVSATLNDTWEYDGTNWQQIVTASAPPPRSSHALAYDSARGRTMLFGGRGFFYLGDTWEYDGTNWRVASPVPTRRHSNALAYDGGRGRTVLFGGSSSGVMLNDTWEYDTARWIQVATANVPLARALHALVHDSARGRTLLFGGAAPSAVALGDTWQYDGTDWRQLATAVTPPARWGHALAFDNLRSRAVLFGGWDVNTNSCFVDTWEHDGVNWTQIATPSTASARAYHSLAYDSARGRTVLFGGLAAFNAPLLNDTWEYDGANWTRNATASAPPPRRYHVLAYDPGGGRTFLFGGYDDATGAYLGDTWQYDGVNWTQAVAPAGSPLVRGYHALAHDSARGRTVLFGGIGPESSYGKDDTWELLPAAAASWTRHGAGCAGSAGTPSLDAAPGALPQLGATFTLQLASLPAQPGLALLAFGTGIARWNGVALPLALERFGLPACKLWIEPGASVAIAHPGLGTSIALPIPATPTLAGMRLCLQAFVFDALAGNGIGSVSNGGVATLF